MLSLLYFPGCSTRFSWDLWCLGVSSYIYEGISWMHNSCKNNRKGAYKW